MKIPRMAELVQADSFLGASVGAICVDILQALGVEDSDLPDIVPDAPTNASEEVMETWMRANLPSVCSKIEALKAAS